MVFSFVFNPEFLECTSIKICLLACVFLDVEQSFSTCVAAGRVTPKMSELYIDSIQTAPLPGEIASPRLVSPDNPRKIPQLFRASFETGPLSPSLAFAMARTRFQCLLSPRYPITGCPRQYEEDDFLESDFSPREIFILRTLRFPEVENVRSRSRTCPFNLCFKS